MFNVCFKGWECATGFGHYHEGHRAIRLADAYDGIPIATATVSIDQDPPLDCVWIKDYSENEGMAQALTRGGVIDPGPVAEAQTGFVTVMAYRLSEEALREFKELEDDFFG